MLPLPLAAAAASTSTLLTSTQQSHLLTLIKAITESMRAKLSDTFIIIPVESVTSAALRFVIQVEGEQPSSTNAGIGARAAADHDVPGVDRLKELKQDALKWFDEWRDCVVMVLSSTNGREDPGIATGPGMEKGPVVESNDFDLDHTDPSSSSFTTVYPPIFSPLSSLPLSTRSGLLSAMLLRALVQGSYAAPTRTLLLHLTSSLHLPLSTLQEAELGTAHTLLNIAAQSQMSAEAETQKRSAANAVSRRWKVGLAGVAGAALIGVTGGLAAPLVAGAIGSVMGGLGLGATAAAGLLGTLGSSGVIVGGLFGAYGYGMTSKMMDRYAKEVEDFAFLSMRKVKGRSNRKMGNDDIGKDEILAGEEKDQRLRVTIGVSGWLAEKRDIMTPWKVFGAQSEVFALRWELEALLDMGVSLETMVSSAVWAVATREIVARTVFASLMFAMWPIALLKVSKVVDNPFNVAKNRADKAGLVLADAIINKAQGERPVTLVGYSVGARLIYSCLMSLAERRAFGLVESAMLIGAPVPSDANAWKAIRSVVSGRLVNVYTEKDYVLAFLYRTSSIQLGVAGLQAIKGVKGVENVDLSASVTSHLRYPHLAGKILKDMGWEDIDLQEVEREQHIAEILDEKDKRRTAELNDEALEIRASTEIVQVIKPREEEVPRQLPKRPEVVVSIDPLGVDNHLGKSKDARFDKALEARLANFSIQEGAQRFRCLAPECQKLFKGKHFWRKHVGVRHAEWLEAIKQEVRTALLESDAPQAEDEQAIPRLPEKTSRDYKDDDLISFDEGPTGDSAVNEVINLPVRLKEQSILDTPKEHQETTRELRDHEHEHVADMSNDSKGIMMVDNDEAELKMLEPVPWPDEK